MKKLKYENGFTLIETIVAVSVVVVGLISALGAITTALFHVSNIQDRLIAANLAAEGIEMIRNIRDNNWLQNLAWNNGLNNGDYQAACGLPACNSIVISSYGGNNLLFDSNTGLYNYSSGANTPYIRKISIANISLYEIRAVSIVTWQRRGTTYTNSAEDHFFNWK